MSPSSYIRNYDDLYSLIVNDSVNGFSKHSDAYYVIIFPYKTFFLINVVPT